MQDMEIEEDDMEVYGDTPGGGNMEFVTADGNVMNQQEMPLERKLQLAERANEIYREQVKYLQEHLNSIRALVQDKESIIENLMLRYDLGILAQDSSRAADYVPSDKIEDRELRRKAEALAQRTILENFELRELVNELRDENFHLRNEIYDLQDRLNRQALHISKMNKNIQMQNPMEQFMTPGNFEDNNDNNDNNYNMTNGVHPNAMTEESQQKREERDAKHNRRQDSIAQPKDFWETNQQQEEEEEEDMDEEPKPRQITSEATNQEFVQENDEQENEEEEDDEEHRDEESKKKLEERKAKTHKRKATLETPENFFDDDYEVSGDTPEKPNTSEKPTDSSNNDRPNKRRGSQKLDVDLLKNSEEAKAKRQERSDKEHTRKESAAAPNNMFETDYANTEEAKKIREERAKKARKESIAVPKGFLNAGDPPDSEDDLSREKRRKHQRKQSLMKAVGDKGHLSDEDTEKTQHVDYETRRKLDKPNRPKKEPAIPENEDITADATTNANVPANPRQSSVRVTDLQFEDPAVLLMAQEEVRTLKEQVKNLEEAKKVAERQLQDQKKEAEQREQKLSQHMKSQMEAKHQQEKEGLVESAKKDVNKVNVQMDELKNQMNTQMNELKNQLTQLTNSKLKLIQCTTNEINCLNRVINQLLQSEKCKEITRLLLDDCRSHS